MYLYRFCIDNNIITLDFTATEFRSVFFRVAFRATGVKRLYT